MEKLEGIDLIDKKVKRFFEDKKRYHFFDANCWIGKSNNLLPFSVWKPAEILDQMDYYGIEKVIVSHTLSRYYHPMIGNKLLLEEIKGEERFKGCFILLPPSTREMGSLDDYLNYMIKNDIYAVKLFPKSHNFSLQEWSIDILLRKLEERGLLLFIRGREIDWDMLYKICKRYPRLPIILEQPDEEAYWNGRILFSLLEKCENLFLEIHNSILYLEVDDLVKRFGADRLIFGSYLPVDDPNSSLMLITDGDFSEEDKEKIAHRNLENLLREVVR